MTKAWCRLKFWRTGNCTVAPPRPSRTSKTARISHTLISRQHCGGAIGKVGNRVRSRKPRKRFFPRLKGRYYKGAKTPCDGNVRRNARNGMKRRRNRRGAFSTPLSPVRRNTPIYDAKASPRLQKFGKIEMECCSFQSGTIRETYKACNISPRTERNASLWAEKFRADTSSFPASRKSRLSSAKDTPPEPASFGQ